MSELPADMTRDELARDELVSASLYFLQTVGNIYGGEAAMAAWEKIADAVDPDLRGQVFKAMLTGSGRGNITIKSCDAMKAIPLIKLIRQYDIRNLGLKEAKDMWTDNRDNGVDINIKVQTDKSVAVREQLRNLGCIFI